MAALGYEQDQIAALAARIARLEILVARLEACGELEYRGVWRPERQYVVGNFCTDHGSLWHCEQSTCSRPGTDSTWRLAVKRGTFT